MPGPPFDVVLLADGPHATTKVLGLTLVERGRRVASKIGARRVLVVRDSRTAGELSRWDDNRGEAALLIIRAGDQVVHPPLVEPLLRGSRDRRIATGSDGRFAGAIWAAGDAAREAIEAIAAAPATADTELATRWNDAERIPHGEIARHAATTAGERAGASRMLLRLITKTEDSAVTRYIYRPISRPITRLLLHTPITPNQISIAVGIIGLLGCWFTAQPGQQSLILGAALVLIAGIIDGCDGEIARLRLTSSKIGAWLDTIVDELTTCAYFLAIGFHTYQHHPDQAWIVPTIVAGAVCYGATVYVIYYFLIVVTRTGNSQHYVGDLEIVDGASGLALRPRPRGPSTLPPWVRTIGALLMLVVRRDFINLGALVLTLVNAYFFIYLTMLAGGVITALIVVPEHVKLRRQLREVARRGEAARYLAS